MERSTVRKPGGARLVVSHCKKLGDRTRASKKTCRGESEAPQDKNTNLDGTEMEQWVKYVEDKLSEINARFEGTEERLQFLEESLSQEAASRIDSCSFRSLEATNKSESSTQTVLSEIVSAEEFRQKEEECKKLKEEKRALQQKLNHVLANAMESHTCSENLNDPCPLSAVLGMYDRLRTHEWEKARCAASGSVFPMTYEKGGTIIKAVFSICEEELSQRLEQIFEPLEIPVSKETTSLFDSQQPVLSPDLQKFQPLVKFTAECYKIYCLLLLQNPPIKPVWPANRIHTDFIEHVDNKEIESCMPITFLWPVLTYGGKVIRNGVIYD
ncbi:uncharacterized protein LOC103306474 isoform X2 [Chrysemys picta bellii]|uniref:uncharacterized protein LOC103306474 isoform X2 n=1 Tax=Chrysemys picta bellii TaxID=8478 RepID=UPI0032B26983